VLLIIFLPSLPDIVQDLGVVVLVWTIEKFKFWLDVLLRSLEEFGEVLDFNLKLFFVGAILKVLSRISVNSNEEIHDFIEGLLLIILQTFNFILN
jgi:hypothetical protein